MNLYLAKVSVRITRYMADDSEFEEKLHVVQAESEDSAYKKVHDYYDAKTEDYCIYYSVNNIEITEGIK